MLEEYFDPRHHIKVKVTIKDTVSGSVVEDSRFSTWWWTDGSGSCDCNRSIFMGDRDPGDEHECVCVRYRVVAVEPLLEGYTLDDFNQGYPPCGGEGA